MPLKYDSLNYTRSEHDLQKELIEYLISHSKKRGSRAVKRKILLWNLAVSGAYVIKRCFDITATLAILVALFPVFLITALWIKLDSKGPLVYKQIRVGLNGRQFDFYKFRSMYVDADKRIAELKKLNESKDGVIFKMKNDPRVTRPGRIIRKFSIDELPQLFNVLKGDMSLVGPRPPLPREVDQYTLDDRKRLNVLPGITCIWQVSGRSDIPFKQQVALDKQYIQSQSFWKDLAIMLKTIPAVLTGKGAY